MQPFTFDNNSIDNVYTSLDLVGANISLTKTSFDTFETDVVKIIAQIISISHDVSNIFIS